MESAIYIAIGPHPNICRFLGYNIIDRRMIMALKFYSLGDLKTQIARYKYQGLKFNTTHIWYLFLHISKALKYINSKGYIFADMKPGNIILEEEVYTNTLGCGMKYIDEDKFARDSNINYLLTDFGHA